MLATHTITMRPIKEGARAAEGKANQWWVSLSGQSIVRPKKVNGNHENIRIAVNFSLLKSNYFLEKSNQCLVIRI